MSDAKTALARDGTMQATAKEAERILDGKKPDEDAQTRGQQKQIEELKKEKTPEPPAKKTKLTKDSTMAATAKEGKALLSGEKLGDTRQETADKKSKAKAPLKKNSTIAKTMEEAKYVLDGEVDVNSGRKTRSQSRGDVPKPPVKKAPAPKRAAKEPANKGKGKKGKVEEPPAEVDSDEKKNAKADTEEKKNAKAETEEKKAPKGKKGKAAAPVEEAPAATTEGDSDEKKSDS
ncbi:neurofilament heavy polypeptide-like [Physella acuta]|uniref:neurofilament heavy polypeptide-like n=1 Tax=Physella acuta TaxID=109671 RepID=UPI0027DDDE24|nr:neurofilament heavy polypeptide-like [Physella acuta]